MIFFTNPFDKAAPFPIFSVAVVVVVERGGERVVGFGRVLVLEFCSVFDKRGESEEWGKKRSYFYVVV